MMELRVIQRRILTLFSNEKLALTVLIRSRQRDTSDLLALEFRLDVRLFIELLLVPLW